MIYRCIVGVGIRIGDRQKFEVAWSLVILVPEIPGPTSYESRGWHRLLSFWQVTLWDVPVPSWRNYAAP